jgi:hypothetical protein
MPLKLRPSGLGSGIDKGRQDYETREGPEKHLRWFRSFAVQGSMTRADRVATFEEARLSKERERRADWQHACRPLMEEAGVAAVTRQIHLALFTDAMLDIEAFESMSSARRWRPGTADTFFPVPDDDAARRPRQSQKGQLGSSREGPCDERPERSFFLCYLERVRRFCSRD